MYSSSTSRKDGRGARERERGGSWRANKRTDGREREAVEVEVEVSVEEFVRGVKVGEDIEGDILIHREK